MRRSLYAFYALFAIAAACQFVPLMPEVFFGDDLNHFLQYRDGQCGTKLLEVLTSICAEKFRPVFTAFMIAEFKLFDTAVSHYLAVDVLIHAASAALVFLIARSLSRGSPAVAFALALAFSVSRFAVFQLTQVDGPVEGIPLLLFLGAVYVVFRAEELPGHAWRSGWIALFLTLLAIHAHERYIGLAPGLFIAFVLIPAFRGLPRRRLVALLVAAAAIPALTIAYKVGVLHSSFLVGTNGTHLDLVGSRVLEHVRQGLLSIFGVNEGPEYLTGVTLTALNWFPAWLCAGVFVAAWTIAMGNGLVRAALRQRGAWARLESLRVPLILAMLFGLLIVPGVTTIRLEQRWLLAPFTMILLMMSWASGAGGPGNSLIRWVPTLLVAASSVILDSVILRHFDNFYLVGSARFAGAVKHDVLGANAPKSSPLVFVTDQAQCGWVLLGGEFFRLYGGAKRSVECISSLKDRHGDLAQSAEMYTVSPARLFDVTEDWRRQERRGPEMTTFDFLGNYDRGSINSDAPVSTPGGRGVFRGRWPSVSGEADTLTVVSGYSLRFDGLVIGPNTALEFGAGMIYPSAYPARAAIRVTEQGSDSPKVVFSKDPVPPGRGEKPHFAAASVSLADYAGKTISVTFAAETPAGDSRAHWIGFSEPKLTSRHSVSPAPRRAPEGSFSSK